MTASVKQKATRKATDCLLCLEDEGMGREHVLNDFENVFHSQ